MVVVAVTLPAMAPLMYPDPRWPLPLWWLPPGCRALLGELTVWDDVAPLDAALPPGIPWLVDADACAAGEALAGPPPNGFIAKIRTEKTASPTSKAKE